MRPQRTFPKCCAAFALASIEDDSRNCILWICHSRVCHSRICPFPGYNFPLHEFSLCDFLSNDFVVSDFPLSTLANSDSGIRSPDRHLALSGQTEKVYIDSVLYPIQSPWVWSSPFTTILCSDQLSPQSSLFNRTCYLSSTHFFQGRTRLISTRLGLVLRVIPLILILPRP
jgi:hypothetical protein